MEKEAGEEKSEMCIRRLKVLVPLPEITHAKGRELRPVRLSAVLQPPADPQHSLASLPGSVEEMSAEEITKTDLLPLAESNSGISTAAGDASISSGMRHQDPLDLSPTRILPETGMHSKDNEHQGAWMDQRRELPARETSGHSSENYRQFLHSRKPHMDNAAAPMFAQRSPQGLAVQMSQGMLVSQGGNGIVKEMPIDEVVLVCLRLCAG
jgi:hypothetical protein